MKKKTLQLTPQISTRINLILVFVLLFGFSKAQQATVSGRVIDEFQFPLMDVEVTDGSETVYTDTNGKYSLNVEAGSDVTIHFDQEGRVSYTETVHLEAGENRDLHVRMA
ncbi:MAG: carboxypeptidase-like regulatory domain-containing protein, partial [Moheibacter sp.]